MPKIAMLLTLVAAMAVGSASGPGTAAADSSTPSVYTDPAGDSASAPDVTKVTLTPGSGTVTVDISYTGALGDDGGLVLLIDVDRNQQTGDQGFEYLVVGRSANLAFAKWDGTQWADFTHQPTNPTLSGTHMTFTITLADIGGVTTFDFAAGSVRNNDGDAAPDNGVATYPAPAPPTPPAPPPATLKALLLPSVVFTARAGKVLRIPPLQVLLTDGTTAKADSRSCTLAYKGKKVPALAGGCAWKIPVKYKNARLTLKITFSYGGQTRITSWPVIPK